MKRGQRRGSSLPKNFVDSNRNFAPKCAKLFVRVAGKYLAVFTSGSLTSYNPCVEESRYKFMQRSIHVRRPLFFFNLRPPSPLSTKLLYLSAVKSGYLKTPFPLLSVSVISGWSPWVARPTATAPWTGDGINNFFL